MFRNYFITILRNLLKHKGYTAANITGLAVGMASFFLIMTYVIEEFSFDRFHENADNVYQVQSTTITQAGSDLYASVPVMLGPLLKENIPEVKQAVRLFNDEAAQIKYKNDTRFEERFIFADSSIFDVFSISFVAGDPRTALRGPGKVVVTRETAERYFGKDDPIGKILLLSEQKLVLTVSGVVECFPVTSHIKYDFLASFGTLNLYMPIRYPFRTWREDWQWNPYWTYIVLPDGYPPGGIDEKIPGLVDTYFPENLRENVAYTLEPISDIHLRSDAQNQIAPGGSREIVYIFWLLAFAILGIACINFMNLSTARYAYRAKEIGLRKVLGAYRSQLIKQFLSESVFLSLCAAPAALLLVFLLQPVFSTLSGRPVEFDLFGSLITPSFTFGTALTVGLISGFYPAFFLSAFKPVSVLSGSLRLGLKNTVIRNVLIIGQFVVSIILFISTFIIFDQINYITHKDLGFNDEEIVFVEFPISLNQYFPAYKDALLQRDDIVGVTTSQDMPGEEVYDFYMRPEGTPAGEVMLIPMILSDRNFAGLFEIEFIEGREASLNSAALTLVLNEAALIKLNWQQPIGKRIDRVSSGVVEWTANVTGVMKDFHFRTLRNEIEPLILGIIPQKNLNLGSLVARIKTKNVSGTLSFMENKWNELISERPFRSTFLEQMIEGQYSQEVALSNISIYLSFLTLFLACFGLFGLASYATSRRTKEIGVRKVFGASVLRVVLMLLWDFTKLILIAFTIAAPIAYIAMSTWLQVYAYHTEISLISFVQALFIALLITWGTIFYRSFKAARANPVDSLQYE